MAGCGGWSYRATLFGGDSSIVARNAVRLNPDTDPAKIRAMYTDPSFARRGVGTYVLSVCEQAAAAAGFQSVELMATAAGLPLYRARGYVPADAASDADIDGVRVPLLRMRKRLTV